MDENLWVRRGTVSNVRRMLTLLTLSGTGREHQELSCGHTGRRVYQELREGAKPKVFISYSHKDKGKVHPIASYLIRSGWDVWLDERRLLGGDQIVPELGKAISDADYYIVFLSKSSVNSPYVQYELTNAITLQIEKNRPRVLPIKLDDSKVPTILGGSTHVVIQKVRFFKLFFTPKPIEIIS
jgi:hypothetical protein